MESKAGFFSWLICFSPEARPKKSTIDHFMEIYGYPPPMPRLFTPQEKSPALIFGQWLA